MIDADRAWARQGNRFPGRKLSDFVLQVIDLSVSLGNAAAAQNQTVNFGASAIILGVMAAAQPTAQAATQTYRPGLDLFSAALSYQATNRQIIGSVESIGSAIFGLYNDRFPGLEIVMSQNTSLAWNFTNLTSTSIQITLSHHCLMPAAVG